MDESRKIRYKTKMRYVIDRLSLAEGLIVNPTETELMALYYSLLTSIESVMDMIAMMIKDLGEIGKGDRHNIELLRTKDHITEELSKDLMACNGLRNVLVHQYNGIDKTIVIESFANVKKALGGMIEIVERFIEES